MNTDTDRPWREALHTELRSMRQCYRLQQYRIANHMNVGRDIVRKTEIQPNRNLRIGTLVRLTIGMNRAAQEQGVNMPHILVTNTLPGGRSIIWPGCEARGNDVWEQRVEVIRQQLIRARHLAGLTAEQVGLAAEVGTRTVGEAEYGSRDTRVATLRSIAHACGIEFQVLFGGQPLHAEG
jgi:DNA-binding XRE family transcriptional regulator